MLSRKTTLIVALTASLALPLKANAQDQGELFDLTLEELLEIEVVTATGQSQKVKHAPAIISVITKKELQDWEINSVAEALSRVPGFYCNYDYYSYNCGVRGISGGFRGHSKVFKVMINGQPITFRSDTNNYLGPELLPMSIVERIEIVRGPSSALYGANAFLGVINIITKQTNTDFLAKLDINQSSIEQGTGYSISALLQGSLSGWQYNLAANASRADRSGIPVPDTLPALSPLQAGQESHKDIAQPVSFYGDIGKNLSSIVTDNDSLDLKLSAWYSKLESNAQWQDFGYFSQSGSLGYGQLLSIENSFVKIAGNYQYSDEFSITASLALSEGNPTDAESLDVGVSSTLFRRKFGFQALDVKVEANWQLSANRSLVVGIDNAANDEDLLEVYRIDKTSGDVSLATGSQGNKNFDDNGLYLQYTDYLSTDFGLTLNVRRDDNNIYGEETNYRGGLVYSFDDRLSAKLLYGTSYKAPAAMQLFTQPLFSGEVNGNPDLRPESAETIEFAVDWQLYEDANLSLTLFQTEVTDKVEVVGTQAINIGLQSSTGFEADFKWLKDNMSLTANLSWQETDTETQNFIGQIIKSPSAAYPQLMANIFAGYRLTDQLSAYVSYHYVSQRRASLTNILLNASQPYQLEAYQLLDFSLSYQLNNAAKLFFKTSNLLNVDYEYVGFNGIDIAGVPRQVTLGFSYSYQ